MRICIHCLCLCSLAALFAIGDCLAEIRTWTATDGRTLQGDYLSHSDDSVSVRRTDGLRVDIPLANLSAGDRAWLAKVSGAPPPGAQFSKLWGEAGELWQPEDKTLIDFSYAGYHEGKNDFPDWEVGTNVRDFGAIGDGVADDTEAFKKAIDACGENQAVLIPNGTYKLMDWIGVNEMVDTWVKPRPKNRYVLRGESRDGVVVLLGTGLQEIHPWSKTTSNDRATSQWSWSGGFLWFQDSTEVGVENLTIRGSGGRYGEHWQEKGHNGIFFRDAGHCWVRNVTLTDVDGGILVNHGTCITLQNILFNSTEGRPSTSDFEDNQGISGHHGILFGGGSALCAADGITFENRFHHELGVNPETHHCVFSNCKGPSLHFDFHTENDDAHHILFTEIDAGEGDLIWRNNFYGSCTGGTFWNIRGRQLSLPEEKSWVKHPMLAEEMSTLFVGWPIELPKVQQPGRPWFEDIEPDALYPQNIYHAQRKKRLGDPVSGVKR